MAIKVSIKPDAMLATLKSAGINLDRIIETVKTIDPKTPILQQVPKLVGIGMQVIEEIQYARQTMGNMTADRAQEIAVSALDALFLFEGSVWGVVPLGTLLESADGLIWTFAVKALYEAVRGRDFRDKSAFEAAINAIR